MEIHSPYRPWFWVSAAAATGLLGASLATQLLARDRQNAMEEWAKEKSCDQPCQEGTAAPKKTFDDKARDWEEEGSRFATMSKIFLGTGIAMAAVSGYLWHVDRKWVRAERSRLLKEPPKKPKAPLMLGVPWIGPGSAGISSIVVF